MKKLMFYAVIMGGASLVFTACDKKNADDEKEVAEGKDVFDEKAFDVEAYERDQARYNADMDQISKQYPEVYYSYYEDPQGWYATNHGTYSVRVYGLDKDAELSKRYNELLRNRYNSRVNRSKYYSTTYTSMAAPKDGYDKFYQKLSEEIEYPADATGKGVEGTIMIAFTVNESGNVENVRVVDGSLYSDAVTSQKFYDEAISAIKSTSGMWTPAVSGGKSVISEMEIPITFKLES